jgi:hypothetical protein
VRVAAHDQVHRVVRAPHRSAWSGSCASSRVKSRSSGRRQRVQRRAAPREWSSTPATHSRAPPTFEQRGAVGQVLHRRGAPPMSRCQRSIPTVWSWFPGTAYTPCGARRPASASSTSRKPAASSAAKSPVSGDQVGPLGGRQAAGAADERERRPLARVQVGEQRDAEALQAGCSPPTWMRVRVTCSQRGSTRNAYAPSAPAPPRAASKGARRERNAGLPFAEPHSG